jgi:hypothetical protein
MSFKSLAETVAEAAAAAASGPSSGTEVKHEPDQAIQWFKSTPLEVAPLKPEEEKSAHTDTIISNVSPVIQPMTHDMSPPIAMLPASDTAASISNDTIPSSAVPTAMAAASATTLSSITLPASSLLTAQLAASNVTASPSALAGMTGSVATSVSATQTRSSIHDLLTQLLPLLKSQSEIDRFQQQQSSSTVGLSSLLNPLLSTVNAEGFAAIASTTSSVPSPSPAVVATSNNSDGSNASMGALVRSKSTKVQELEEDELAAEIKEYELRRMRRSEAARGDNTNNTSSRDSIDEEMPIPAKQPASAAVAVATPTSTVTTSVVSTPIAPTPPSTAVTSTTTTTTTPTTAAPLQVTLSPIPGLSNETARDGAAAADARSAAIIRKMQERVAYLEKANYLEQQRMRSMVSDLERKNMELVAKNKNDEIKRKQPKQAVTNTKDKAEPPPVPLMYVILIHIIC